jgi:long-subunit acyl-CoA synthetase (AMP-forming)
MHILEDVRLRPMPHIGGKNIWALEHPPAAHRPGLTDIAKITYTSGTTGAPKGVCLSPRTLDTVSESLNRQIDGVPGDRHLCLMPLSILLENVGGLYLSMLSGGECYLPGPGETGVGGSSEVDADKLVSIIRNSKAGRIILTPQLLHILVSKIERGYSLPTLKFVAVGGAPLSTNLLRRAVRCGLPVFEGYGLSECGSVVAVNTTTHNKPGSVGRPLPHVELRFGCDGEIFVKGTLFKNYLGTTPATKNGFFATGDIGYLDTDGYLFITGRKKNMFITSFGRNVAPEWVENELALQPSIAQAVVFGEGRPWSTAVIVPRSAAVGHSEPELDYAIHTVNEQLPDYARIGAWITADEPFSLANDQFTATGRPRRQAIWARYASRIDAIYHTESRNKRSL